MHNSSRMHLIDETQTICSIYSQISFNSKLVGRFIFMKNLNEWISRVSTWNSFSSKSFLILEKELKLLKELRQMTHRFEFQDILNKKTFSYLFTFRYCWIEFFSLIKFKCYCRSPVSTENSVFFVAYVHSCQIRCDRYSFTTTFENYIVNTLTIDNFTASSCSEISLTCYCQHHLDYRILHYFSVAFHTVSDWYQFPYYCWNVRQTLMTWWNQCSMRSK